MSYTLITGASRGIGEAIAEYCGSKGYNLFLTARNEEKLNELALYIQKKHGVNVKIYVADLTHDDAIEKLNAFLDEENITIDKLINNAGIGLYGRFAENHLEDQLKLIQLNQIATVKLVHMLIPRLKRSGKGYVLNVASTASYQPIPFMAIYAATQSFLLSFTRALRDELKGTGISVSCLCPGPTASDFFERAGLGRSPVNSPEIKMTSKEVAETAIEGMLDSVAEIIPGTSNTLGAYFSKLFPTSWVMKTVSGIFTPKTT